MPSIGGTDQAARPREVDRLPEFASGPQHAPPTRTSRGSPALPYGLCALLAVVVGPAERVGVGGREKGTG